MNQKRSIHSSQYCTNTIDTAHSHAEPEILDDYHFKTTLCQLPPNIYSVIIVSSSIEFGNSEMVNRVMNAEIYFLMMTNVLVQFIACYFTYKLYSDALEENDDHSCGQFTTDKNLRWMAVGVWSFSLLTDIYETYHMQIWITYAFGDEELTLYKKILEDYADDRCCCKASYWLLPSAMREAYLVDEDGEIVNDGNPYEILKALQSASLCNQIFIKVVVLGVKYFVAIVMALVGTGWLVQAQENEDLLLDCIALEFVVHLSKDVYDFFISHELKRFVEKECPKFLVKYEEDPTKCHRASGIAKKGFILLIFSLGCNLLFCRESANFTLHFF